MTLRNILESPKIPKVFFDVRNDSGALYTHYQIALQGIEDVKLMENASRRLGSSKQYINGLAKCVKRDLTLPYAAKKQWEDTKTQGERLFLLNWRARTKFSMSGH